LKRAGKARLHGNNSERGMIIDERNEALLEFKTKSNIFISTDAGGEGLNLQFSNIIINYDLQ
jgi:superfamily II DNA/RNA helicase